MAETGPRTQHRDVGPETSPSPTEQHLFRDRTVLVFGEIGPELAQCTSAQLLALAAASSAPIRVWLHSPGGHVESGDSIHDVIRFIAPEVTILGSGWVASAGALIYCAVDRDHRLTLPNTRFLLHEPSGGFGGTAADIEIEARQVARMRTRLNAIFAQATGRAVADIERDTARNHWMDADEARAYGLVGRIVTHAREV